MEMRITSVSEDIDYRVRVLCEAAHRGWSECSYHKYDLLIKSHIYRNLGSPGVDDKLYVTMSTEVDHINEIRRLKEQLVEEKKKTKASIARMEKAIQERNTYLET